AGYQDHPREPLRLAAIESLGLLHDERARVLLEPLTAPAQNDRVSLTAERALQELDAREGAGEGADATELQRKVRELRQSVDKLEKSLEQLKAKAEAAPAEE
ncbi:MAG TPA: hypothetical protein VEQ85_00675, partial [Lacipirellulaceae bacterium]|nr:hypothetical protein [Lacipirellulaceae bacterium]